MHGTQTKLDRLDELHRAVGRRLAELERREDALGRSGAGTWSVTDVYAHLGRWAELGRNDLDAYVRGESLPEHPMYQVLNAEWVGKDEPLSLEDARHRFVDRYASLRGLLASLDERQWDATVDDYVNQVIEHYEDHLRAPLEFEVAPGG